MRKTTLSIFCLLGLAFAMSCKEKKTAQTATPVQVESRNIQQQKGTDCDKQPDSLRTDCAIVDISVPKINGTNALSKNVDAWADMYLLHQINWAIASEDGNEPKTVDEGIKRFFANHAENTGSVSAGQYKLTCTHEELLNDGKYLTLKLNGYAFTGGNRALDDVAIASFDVKTGKQLTWDDLVKDKKALLQIAQAKVEEARADAFKEGFAFDKEEPFAFPMAYGLTADGILMHYLPSEIYQLGGTTEFTVPFSEIGQNLKVTAPAAPKEIVTADDILGIYEVAGDSIIIPTFEIEVANSPAADKTLTKKKETILVSAFFWAIPSDPKQKAKGEDGEITVGRKDIELSGSNHVARFEGLKFHKNLLKKMEDSDISLLINVYSGRKSSQDNLLTCGLVEAKASQFANKRYVLGCQLISEPVNAKTDMANTLACYALPDEEEAPKAQLAFLVECDSVGNISFAGNPMKNLDALKAALKPLVKDWLKKDAKNLPGIETEGCLMGNSGAIRDMYEELKTELGVKTNTEAPAEDKKTPEKKTETTDKGKTTDKEKTTTTSPAKTLSNQSPKKGDAGKAVPKDASKAAGPVVTLKQNGDLQLNGKAVGSFEELRKQLQAALLAQATIPDKVELKTVGETGMGARAEVNTVIDESIKGAKWVRKKAAIAALNDAVGKKLGMTTQLELGTYQTNGNFAYISAKPKQADGKAIDYSKTSYAKEAAAGKFADNAIGLLQYDKGGWKVLNYNLGLTKAPADAWVKTYKAPKALF